MFGGGPSGGYLNDLWTLDGSLTWNLQHDGTRAAPKRGMATLLLGTPTTSFCGCSVDGQVPMGREGDVELGGLFHGLEFVCYEVLLSNF